MRKFLALVFGLIAICTMAQTGNVNISIYDQFTQKPLQAQVQILDTEVTVEGFGNVLISDLNQGLYSFEISAEGYETGYLEEINVLPNQNISLSIGLYQSIQELEQAVIVKKTYRTTPESPLSLRNITSEEVQKNAGSNRDVSKAILSFPGVGSTATFRNDLFIRGGASSENKFFVDGIEVPVINHFQAQGASGGPRGILTVDFIRDVDFYSGAFPAERNGVLSSLFEFNLKAARKDKFGYKGIVGLDDLQLMADGPLSKDQSWTGLFSVRKSNLQLLFSAIGLPFLPSYYDATFKVSKKFQSGDEFFVLGIGAIDRFEFNDDAEPTLDNLTLIDRLPNSPQWNYTIGAGYRRLTENGNWLFTWSRNMLDNQSTKYFRNIEQAENLLYDYHSQEAENKIRIDRKLKFGNFQFSFGGNLNFANYKNNSIIRAVNQTQIDEDNLDVNLNLFQYGMYVQTSTNFFQKALQISLGARVDASDYSSQMENPLEQFSPRFSLSYKFAPQFAFNFNTGIYHQLPTYLALGFGENGNYFNQNSLKYIQNTHLVGGFEFNGKNNLRITVEGYFKQYKNYLFSLRNQVSLANLGGDFGVVGNEPLDSRGKGETYGLELLVQKRTLKDFYGIAAYTFGYSKFSNAEGEFLPSSWDSRHILSLTAGKYFSKNWNLGMRFRMQSGLPETPYDLERSAFVENWNVANGPLYDYSQLNTLRGNLAHQLDVRVEKKWSFSKWQMTAYMDVVNVYGSKKSSNLPVVNLLRDESNQPIILNPQDPTSEQKYALQLGEQDRNTVLPYFGLIFEF